MKENQYISESQEIQFLKSENNFNSLINSVLPLLPSKISKPEILVITSYPPRECGIATYAYDLIVSLKNKFINSFKLTICALETDSEKHIYPEKVNYILNTDAAHEFSNLAAAINASHSIKLVLIQHEFGLFANNEEAFQQFLEAVSKPVIIVFHTVLPKPNARFLLKVQKIIANSTAIIVMTQASASILENDYSIENQKINIISHGTHLVSLRNKNVLKQKYNLVGKKVLTTFGLLSSGKGIETTLNALPSIIRCNPDILFLIIGKTHPSVAKHEGESYRESLEDKIVSLNLFSNVRFVNQFLPLNTLLEYLQLTDIYLFTSKDPNQAVSGTFSYALSSGCPIISTPIPQAKDLLRYKIGELIDFECSSQLADAVNSMLANETVRNQMSLNALHMMAPTAWENSAIAHAKLFEKLLLNISLKFRTPIINLNHIQKLTTDFGMIQFSVINQPDIGSGYTLDDNARALIAMCQHFELTHSETDILAINKYLSFIKFCQSTNGSFLNYVDEAYNFTQQNDETNLADSNGRAIWALGYLLSLSEILPEALVRLANNIMEKALPEALNIHSSRAMAFIIKGLYYSSLTMPSEQNNYSIKLLANRLLQMYKHEANPNWYWYESYLTYANSILPEAMLCAFLATNDIRYKTVALQSFEFLLGKIFTKNRINVISNKNWLLNGYTTKTDFIGGEQAIDVAYTIIALCKFAQVTGNDDFKQKLDIAFSWFLGNNHLNQIVYNPCTGGCYDGLEETYMNLNQGAESTVSYLMAMLALEKNKVLTEKSKENQPANLVLS